MHRQSRYFMMYLISLSCPLKNNECMMMPLIGIHVISFLLACLWAISDLCHMRGTNRNWVTRTMH